MYNGIFRATFFVFCAPFFALHILHQGRAFAQKLKGFHGLFFRGINKTQKVYEGFVLRGVFHENIREILAKSM